MRRILILLCTVIAHPLFAEQSFVFKKEVVNNHHWLAYGLVFLVLLAALLVLTKKSKTLLKKPIQSSVLELLPLGQKTKVYVIEYQGQQFLVADNQQALAIHSVQGGLCESPA
ncbi:MAG: hypothetical protein ACHP6H_01925 [Legionellales bacterium]